MSFFSRHREEFTVIRDYVIGWLLALTLWTIVRSVGVTVNGPVNEPTLLHNIRIVIVFGILMGVLFGIAQLKLERYLYRRVPLWRLVLYGLLTDVAIMAIMFSMAYRIFRDIVGFNEDVSFLQFIQNPSAILVFLYSILVSFVLASIRQLNLLLGKGNLWRFIKGDFYQPRVENRIFMFVDLKDSTGIAERLGHINYSSFIQDCFYDLHVVQNYKAEVYQYVGDEVVLSWKVTKELDYSLCIQAFWAFEDRLLARADFYNQKYDLIPTFKAGLHFGEVTTAEVGEIKKEIAYHGDTMNIASRIQNKCNDFGRTLLISQFFREEIKKHKYFNLELMGNELLKGKNQVIDIYAVNRA